MAQPLRFLVSWRRLSTRFFNANHAVVVKYIFALKARFGCILDLFVGYLELLSFISVVNIP